MTQTMIIILSAAILDLAWGNPRAWFHPVTIFGRIAQAAEPFFRQMRWPPLLSGSLYTLLLIAGCGGVAWLAVKLAYCLHDWMGIFLEIILVFSCLSIRNLHRDTMQVVAPLKRNDPLMARQRLQTLVHRDLEGLPPAGVARAAIENMATHLVDRFSAPLLFAALGGAPLALAYCMVRTLKALVVQNETRHLHFGRPGRILNDLLNWLPARLTVLATAAMAQLLVGRGIRCLQTVWHQGHRHPLANAGYSQAAFAGTLGVRLGGASQYDGRWMDQPLIGESFRAPTVFDIHRAGQLLMLSAVGWSVLLLWLLWIVALFR